MESVLKWVVEAVGGDADVLSVTPLKGGISATLHSVKLLLNRKVQSFVLRQFTNKEWLQQEPDLAHHEAESLTFALQVGVLTPELIAYKETDTPAVLMTMLKGAVELQPARMEEWLQQLAETLVSIHEVSAESYGRFYFPYNDPERLSVPQWSSQKELWQKALDVVQGPKPETKFCLIHRDYHPTNVLWENGKVCGVVDWVNACRGPAGVDVGHCRLNLALLKGVQAADIFLDAYQRLAGSTFTYEPYWDLVSLMEALPNPPEVYQGWIDLGVTSLNKEILKQRYENLLASVVRRVDRSKGFTP